MSTSITVAIPCYNGMAFIGQTIEAVLNQSRKPDEVLVVDDGSKDDTATIAARYPIQLIRHPQNMGLSAGRNTALEHTRTEVLVYVDADAFADPHMLAVLEPELAGRTFVGAGGQGIEAVQNNVYDVWRSLHARQWQGPQRLENVPYLSGLCMGYRCHALRAVGGFDRMFRTNAEDMDMGYRLNDAGFRLVYNPDARVYHQRKDDRTSLRRMMRQWYYWAFIGKKKNHRQPWMLALGTLRRMLITDTLPDLTRPQGLTLARLDIELSILKLQGIFEAARAAQVRK